MHIEVLLQRLSRQNNIQWILQLVFGWWGLIQVNLRYLQESKQQEKWSWDHQLFYVDNYAEIGVTEIIHELQVWLPWQRRIWRAIRFQRKRLKYQQMCTRYFLEMKCIIRRKPVMEIFGKEFNGFQSILVGFAFAHFFLLKIKKILKKFIICITCLYFLISNMSSQSFYRQNN